MGYLKGKSSTMLYEQFGELKYKYRNREFWCKGYYVDTTGKNSSRIAEYIRNQLKEDYLGEQLTISGMTPFKQKRQSKFTQLASVLTRFTCRDDYRALPAYEIPRVLRVDVYFFL